MICTVKNCETFWGGSPVQRCNRLETGVVRILIYSVKVFFLFFFRQFNKAGLFYFLVLFCGFTKDPTRITTPLERFPDVALLFSLSLYFTFAQWIRVCTTPSLCHKGWVELKQRYWTVILSVHFNVKASVSFTLLHSARRPKYFPWHLHM